MDEKNQDAQKQEQQQDSGPGHDSEHAKEFKAVPRGRVIIGLIVLLIVAAVLVITGIVPRLRARKHLVTTTNALSAPTVLVAKPTQGQPSQEVVLPGNIQAYTDSPIYARTNGYLKKWYFDIGAHVKKGQLMAEIESPEIDQQLAQAQADLATAQAGANNAQTDAARYNELVKSDAVSQEQVDALNTQAASTKTTVQSAQANVQRVQQLVGFEKIVAPFDGVVTARNVDIGQLISSGSSTELFHLAAVNTLRVYVNVPEIYSRAAVRGMVADLTFSEFPGRKFQGKLVRTSAQIDPVSRTLLAELDVDNRKGELFPGAYTEVHLKVKAGVPTYVVPVSALMYRSEGLRIAVVEPGNKAHLAPITVGEDDGRTVQIISGIDANSQVIQNPPDSLIDGEAVQVSSQRPTAEGQNPPSQGQGGGQSGGQGKGGQSQGGQSKSSGGQQKSGSPR